MWKPQEEGVREIRTDVLNATIDPFIVFIVFVSELFRNGRELRKLLGHWWWYIHTNPTEQTSLYIPVV